MSHMLAVASFTHSVDPTTNCLQCSGSHTSFEYISPWPRHTLTTFIAYSRICHLVSTWKTPQNIVSKGPLTTSHPEDSCRCFSCVLLLHSYCTWPPSSTALANHPFVGKWFFLCPLHQETLQNRVVLLSSSYGALSLLFVGRAAFRFLSSAVRPTSVLFCISGAMMS